MTMLAAKPSYQSGDATAEYPFTKSDFRQIADLIKETAGIDLAESKMALVYSRLAKRLRATNIDTFSDYCAFITSADGADEFPNMMNALTTNVTRFFREPHHFEILKTKVLPGLMADAKKGRRVRIWSSACSSGEEPYSIALTLLSLFPDAASHDVKILATDIDSNILNIARRGVYKSPRLEAVSDDYRDRFFEPVNGGDNDWQVKDTVKSLISFKPLNLIKNWPISGKFDVVFCRNVVIYFDEPTQSELWQKFSTVMDPNGWLFIGHSERIAGPAAANFHSEGFTAYRFAS